MSRSIRFCTALLLAAAGFAQISMPLIGYYRDRSGALRPVHGVAGAFSPGDVLQTDVLSVAWSGSEGFAKTDGELLLLDESGISRRLGAPSGPASFGFLSNGKAGWVRFADGSCRSFGADCPSDLPSPPVLRLRLPQPVEEIEQLGEGWLLARGKDVIYAVRSRPDVDEAFELPEAGQ